ncbi:MAG: hypothetical protein ACE5NN_01070, partial [Candidatus Bathyarchaeia archaeon]
MPKITKEMVLEGYGYKVEVPASEYGEDIIFIVSSPSASDVSKARALRMKLSELKGEVDPSKIDLSKALIAEERARRFLIAKALTRGMGEEWTVEDVDKIRPVVLRRLWEAVDFLTGFT